MSTEVRNQNANATTAVDAPVVPLTDATARRSGTALLSDDSRLAIEIREHVERGEMEEARQRFEGLVVAHQRRALRIAFQYLRDAAEADEAVQDAFVKVFSHIGSYREAWPFEVWFTRILINGCLDRRKARVRRDRWLVSADETNGHGSISHDRAIFTSGTMTTGSSDPEARLLARERRARM